MYHISYIICNIIYSQLLNMNIMRYNLYQPPTFCLDLGGAAASKPATTAQVQIALLLDLTIKVHRPNLWPFSWDE